MEACTTPANSNLSHRPQIWAVGGGKGGVGKSLITANMGVALARSGKQCILIDADLGGANLHTLLGISCPKASIADLLRRKANDLSELLTATPISNLQLISGARPLFEMANPHHQQKLKIIRQISMLQADYVLLDLGAGSSFNTLDFFLSADEQFIIVAPLPTAIENAYHFLKAAFYRKMGKAIRRAGISHAVERAMKERAALEIRSPQDLLDHILEMDPLKGLSVRQDIQALQPRIIVNQLRREEDLYLGPQMAKAGSDYFGTHFRYLETIRNDDRVYRAVQMRRPVLEIFPETGFSLAVRGIVRQMLDSREIRNDGEKSAQGV